MPSEILNINDDYIAFCFNEACMYILQQLNEGKIPKWKDKKSTKNNTALIEFMQKHS